MAPRREKTTKGKSLQMFSDFDNDSSGDGDDYRKKRDRNNQVCINVILNSTIFSNNYH